MIRVSQENWNRALVDAFEAKYYRHALEYLAKGVSVDAAFARDTLREGAKSAQDLADLLQPPVGPRAV